MRTAHATKHGVIHYIIAFSQPDNYNILEMVLFSAKKITDGGQVNGCA